MSSLDTFKHNTTGDKASETNGSSRAPSPNRGASQKDSDVVKEGVSKASWLESKGIDKSKRVMLTKVSHMRYQHPNLDQVTKFLRHFGMQVAKKTETQLWFCGYGPDQYVYYVQEGTPKFLGGAFEVESYEELENILRIPSVEVLNGGVVEMTNAPGAGHMVSILDPEGFPVNFVFGQASRSNQPPTHTPGLVFNYETEKPRQRKFQRFKPGPAPVHKLGHFGLCVNNFQGQLDFYTRFFNIVPSDILYMAGTANRTEVAMFGHIDRGLELVDHHTLFLTALQPGNEPHVHHCSFEVHDFDTQALGHQWLAEQKYESVWGVGRHILGSQIFDYWYGPDKFMIEHYCDGDIVNEDTPLAYGPAGHEGLAVWGPEVPAAFLQ